jgi:DNA polymerase III delta prime subunit
MSTKRFYIHMIFGEANIEEFEEENFEEVNLTACNRYSYSSEEDLREAIDMLYTAQAIYHIISEEEYNLLMK